MSTRQFIFVLAVAAMLAAGVGLVVGSRTTPREVPVATMLAAAQQPVPQPTAKKPSAVAHDETPVAPVTTGVEIARVVTTDVAPNKSESDANAKSAEDKSAAAKKSSAKNTTAKKSESADSTKPSAHEAPDMKATEASKRAPSATSMPDAPVGPTASDSDLVFVTKSSLIQARIAANEAAAVATLHSLGTAEAIIETSGSIDTDRDGAGEYAYFGELSAAVPCRAAPGVTREKLQPPVLSTAFATVTSAGNVARTGYFFRIYLPGTQVDGKTPGIAESAGGGCDPKSAQPDHDNCEVLWSCYAWPIEAKSSGTRAFFMDQEGDLLVLANADGGYSGEEHAPAFDAASTKPGDMAQEPLPGAKYADGRAWSAYSGKEPEIPALVEIGPATAADAAKFNTPDCKEDKVVVPSKLVHAKGATRKPAMQEKAAGSVKPTAQTNTTSALKSLASEKSSAIAKSPVAESPTPSQSSVAEIDGKVVANLRSIAMAQSKAQALAAIDTDKDGQGEYGFFGELAGTSPCRAPAGGKRALMKPSVLDASWGKVTESGNVVMDGYVYRMYLPAATKGSTPAICEAPGGGCVTSGARPDHDSAENLWSVYAWPLEAGKNGQRAYFMNQKGEILATPNTDGLYTGEQRAPAFDAALVSSQAGDMYGTPANGGMAVDGRVWSVLH